MIGIFTRTLILVLGYIYPAYDCYKTVELNKPEIDQLRFWCQYWILLAIVTVLERIGDNFVSWLPMYSEAKLTFIVYLWYPKSRGTTYVYNTFFRPYLANHETQIDQYLNETRSLVADVASLYFQKVSSYGQIRFYEVLQYIASQSDGPSGSRPVQRRVQHQPQQQGSGMLPETPNTASTALVQAPPVPSVNKNPQLPQQAATSEMILQRDETVQNDAPDVAIGEVGFGFRLRRRLGLVSAVGSASSSH